MRRLIVCNRCNGVGHTIEQCPFPPDFDFPTPQAGSVAIESFPAPAPRSEWPFIVRIIARFSAADHTGIGDTLATAFEMMGADVVVEALKKAGIECHCSRRQAWLNARFPYR